MGREQRAGAERRQAAKVRAWRDGVPTVVTIDEQPFLELQAASRDAVKTELVIKSIQRALADRLGQAMRAAGLDPRFSYRLNDADRTAELVE